MDFFKRQILRMISIVIMVLSVISTTGCKSEYEDLDLTMYQYRDTKNLVMFVYNAALKLENEGLNSLNYFRAHRDLFNKPDYYLYIYDMNGTNIYHAGMQELEGKNLSNITDKNGKKITKMILEALKDQNNPHAWVHYSWWEPGKFYSVPKSSCHFQVTTPEGKEFFVGGGLNYPHEEKEFIRIIVDNAAGLIGSKGQEALAEISNPVSHFNYRDVRVFAFCENGELLISPVVNDTLSQIKLLECVDEVGYKPFATALKKLKSEDQIWDVFLAKNRYQRVLVKKCLYLRKTVISEEEVFVGAITDLPHPSWTE